MYFIPRLKVDATKPPKSVTTPPPTFIIKDFLSPSSSDKAFQTPAQVSMFLLISPASISIISISKVVTKCDKKYGKQCVCVLESKE